VLLDSVGEKAEVTDAHEAIGQYVEQETADELVGVEGASISADLCLVDPGSA